MERTCLRNDVVIVRGGTVKTAWSLLGAQAWWPDVANFKKEQAKLEDMRVRRPNYQINIVSSESDRRSRLVLIHRVSGSSHFPGVEVHNRLVAPTVA